MTRMNSDDCCRPDGHQARWPMSSYSARDPDPGSLVRTFLGRASVSSSVTDAPGTSRFDRGVAWAEGTPAAFARAMEPLSLSWVVEGRARARTSTGTHVPGARHAPTRERHEGTAATLWPCPASDGSAFSCSRSPSRRPPAAAAPPPSFDPTGDCTTDGRAPGAYPDLEALVPTKFMNAAPGTLDSGRNCTATNLGSLAQAGHQGGPLRRWDVDVRRRAGGGPGGLPDARADGGLPGRLLRRERARRGADGHPRCVAADDRRPAGRPPRHEDRRAPPDGRRLAVRDDRRRQRGHHE